MKDLSLSKLFLTFLFALLFAFSAFSQKDTEFWFVVPAITQNHGDTPLKFVFTNQDTVAPAHITLQMPANTAFTPVTLTVAPEATEELTFERGVDPEFDMLENNTVIDELATPLDVDNIGDKAVQIISDNEITVYFTVDYENNSDIYSLKGSNGIGKEFFVPFQDIGYNQRPTYYERGFSSTEIIGIEDGTVVEITPPVGKEVYRSGTQKNHLGPYTITLDKGEVYTMPPGWDNGVSDNNGSLTGWFGVSSAQHLGGTYIKVINGSGVAVINKDDSVIGNSGGGWDIIGDQLVPLEILGTEYIAMRGYLNNTYESLSVVATANNTNIWLAGSDTTINAPDYSLDKGEQVRIPFPNGAYANNFLHLISNHKMAVLHVSGKVDEFGGAFLPPIDECTGSYSVAFTRDGKWDFYLNIMVRKGGENSFKVNGVKRDDIIDPLGFKNIPGNPDWVAQQIKGNLTDFPANDPGRITNSTNLFHLGLIHGSGSGCRYGYFSGFSTAEGKAYSIIGDGEVPTSAVRACYGDSLQLKAQGGNSYHWWPATGLSHTDNGSPKAAVDEAITYFVEITGDCGLKDTASVSIQVLPQPEASFMISSGSGCSPKEVQIRNLSKQVNQIYWDFNKTLIGGTNDKDQTIYHPSVVTDVDNSFSHTFTNPTVAPNDSAQTYEVELVVKTTICSDTMRGSVTVYPEVIADYSLAGGWTDTVACTPHQVDFVDQSQNADTYKWFFGDGATDTDTDPSHLYENYSTANDTVYNSMLVVRSDFNCRDTLKQDFTIHPYLEAGFTLDEDRVCAPYRVALPNTSEGADHLYWDLGDGTTVDMASVDTVFHTYENTTTAPIDFPIELRVTNTQGCEEFYYDTITVLPEVHANYTVSANEGCNSVTINFNNNSSAAASMILWKFGDGVSTTTPTLSHTYNNSFGHDTTYTFRMAAMSSHGCFDDTSGTVTVYSANADFTVDRNEGCSPMPVTLVNNSTGSNLSYQWNLGDGTTSTDPLPAVNPHTYTNTSGTADGHTLRLDVLGNGGCSDFMKVPITVYSSVNAQYTMSANEVCDSTEVTFTNTSSSFTGGHPATYLWDFGDGTTSSLAEPAHVFRNVTGGPVNYTIRLTVTTANGCTDVFERTLRVHPYVKAEFTVKEVAGCSPFTTEVQTTTYAGNTTYSWDFGAAGTDNVAQPGAKTYTLTTGGSQVNTISLTVADASGLCQDQMSIPVEVYSSVVSDFTVTPSEGCNPLDVALQSTSDAWAQNLTWDFGDGSSASASGAADKQSHRYFNSQAADEVYTATLQVETAHGCEHSSTRDITVYPFVLADFSINKAQGCSPLEVTVDNRSFGGNYRIFWDDTNLAGPADETYSSRGTTTHTYTNSSGSSQTHQLTIIADNGAGCYDTLKRTITVHSAIDAQFAMDVDEGCTPLDVDFTNNTQFANSYQWTFGDGASSNMESPQHRYENLELNDQSFDVKMIAESPFGCIDSITQTIDVWSYVKANFSVEDNEGCPPFDVVFENTSVGNASNTYSWSIDGAVEATAPTNRNDFTYQFDNATVSVRNYQINLVATNAHGCTHEKTDVISVYENVTADFDLSSVGECTPMEMVYEDLSSVPANTNYFWEFGDGATSGNQEPTHTFYNTSRTDDRQFTTKLKVVSQHYCEDSISQDFVVYHQPKAQFDIDNTSSCPPLEVNLKNKSLGADQFVWRLGDGSERSNIEELSWSYDNTANSIRDYELELWTSTIHGCTDSASLMLNVFPRVEAAFSYDTSGCSPFVSSFINTSLNADYYYWEFDDGNTSSQQDPIHRFSNTTDADKLYNVYLRASSEYNCVDEVTNQVTAFAQPIAEFNVEPIVQRFPENRVFISDASNAGPWSYQWTLGDGQKVNGDINYHDYEHWGDYDITLSLNSTTSPCSDAVTRSVTILPPMIDARFSTDRVDGCAPLTVEFEAAASFYNENYTYEWDFGDGTTGTGATPTHVYDQYGTFMVKLTAKGEGGSDYAYRKITVYQVPVAQFELAPKASMLNEEMQARVEYYNLSTCGDTIGCDYLWAFGDGATSTDKDAVYHYDELGEYDVSLRVTSSKGCVDEITIPKGVEVIGEGVMKFPNAFVPSTEGPNGGYYATPDYKNQVFHPVAKGVIDYKLVIYNRWGEIVFETKDIEVGWDGYIDGKLAKQDVYVYKATGKFTNGEPFEIVGDVTVIQ